MAWPALEPDFPTILPYSVVSSLQIWCRLWEAMQVDRIVNRLAETDFDSLFPKVMPDCFCPQGIPLGQ